MKVRRMPCLPRYDKLLEDDEMLIISGVGRRQLVGWNAAIVNRSTKITFILISLAINTIIIIIYKP